MFKYLLVMSLSLMVFAVTAQADISSFFDSGDDGWTILDVDCYDGYDIQYVTIPLAWQGTGGDPDGYVSHFDQTNHCSFFLAPAGYLGDKSDYINGHLEFSMFATQSDWQFEDVVVLIGAGLVASHELPEMPPPSWHHYIIPLEASSFTYDDESGSPVSEADFLAIMADLQVLLLPAEFGAEVEETAGLDTVLMSTSPTPVLEGNLLFARLHDAFPNPFNPRTTIAFDMPRRAEVRLAVYDVSGRLVDVLLDGDTVAQGRNEVVWRGHDSADRVVPAGVFFYRLETGFYSETKRMVLVK